VLLGREKGNKSELEVSFSLSAMCVKIDRCVGDKEKKRSKEIARRLG